MTPDTRAALRCIAVLGPTFSPSILERCGLGAPAAIDEARACGILQMDGESIRFADVDVCASLADELESDAAVALAVRLRVARAEYDCLRYAEAVVHYRAALRVQPRSAVPRGQILLELARAQARAGLVEEAWRTCEEAADVGRAMHDGCLVADAATVLRGGRHWFAGARQASMCVEALGMIEPADHRRQTRLRAQLASVSSPFVDGSSARRRESVPAPDRATSDTDAETAFLVLQAQHAEQVNIEHVETRLALADAAMALGLSSGVDEYVAWGTFWRLDALYQIGQRVELEAELMTVAALAERMREPVWSWRLLNVRSSIAILDGRYDDARRIAQDARQLGNDCGLQEAEFVYLIASSRLAMLTGVGLAAVEQQVRGVLEGAPYFARGWHAQVLLAMDRCDEAHTIWQALAPHVEEMPRNSAEWIIAQTGHSDLCVFFDDRVAAERLHSLLVPFERMNAVAGAMSPPDGPVALRLGRLRALMGDYRGARRDLEVAVRLGECLGSAPFTAEARAELAAARVGAHNLSPRELEIAGLVAEGLTNRQIAERLHLSERTVENHVSHILRKLDVFSRASIASWFSRSI